MLPCLPSPDKAGITPFADFLRTQPQTKVAGTLCQAPKIVARSTQEIPAQVQRGRLELIAARARRPGVRRQIGNRIAEFQASGAGTDDRPAAFPDYRSQKGFASQITRVPAIRTGCQYHHPPFAGLGVHQIGMPYVSERFLGRVNQNVLPSPTIESTPTRPPYNATIFFTMARPMPVLSC